MKKIATVDTNLICQRVLIEYDDVLSGKTTRAFTAPIDGGKISEGELLVYPLLANFTTDETVEPLTCNAGELATVIERELDSYLESTEMFRDKPAELPTPIVPEQTIEMWKQDVTVETDKNTQWMAVAIVDTVNRKLERVEFVAHNLGTDPNKRLTSKHMGNGLMSFQLFVGIVDMNDVKFMTADYLRLDHFRAIYFFLKGYFGYSVDMTEFVMKTITG